MPIPPSLLDRERRQHRANRIRTRIEERGARRMDRKADSLARS